MEGIPERFRAFRIESSAGHHRAGLVPLTLAELTPGELVVRVHYSSVNYKDALAGAGRSKILRRSPLVGGIDLAGVVVASEDPDFRPGDAVLCTGCGLSETRDGGYAEYARVESASAIRLPEGLSLKESMILGTAGFTAALALYRLEQNGQHPGMGPVVVTGATGGVGMFAIDILAGAGYEVHAISGKPEHFDFLIELGARQCISRQGLHWGERPLESAAWAGAIDNVGGDMLSGLTRVISPYGNIACCGLAGGHDLKTTVMPFIIRGVSLLGIASAGTERRIREELWRRLAGAWKPRHLERILTREVGLEELPEVFSHMLAGGSFGRTLVRVLEVTSADESG